MPVMAATAAGTEDESAQKITAMMKTMPAKATTMAANRNGLPRRCHRSGPYGGSAAALGS